LVSSLKSMKGQAPWPYEDLNLNDGLVLSEAKVSFFVAGLLEAASDGSNLKDLWIKEALTWAVESSSRHISCRSFQVGYLRNISRKSQLTPPGLEGTGAVCVQRGLRQPGEVREVLLCRNYGDVDGMSAGSASDNEGNPLCCLRSSWYLG